MAQPDIPSWRLNVSAQSRLIQLKSTLESSHKMWEVSKNVCIYRVPKPIMNSKREAYVPLIVSFGPYHHNSNPEFSRMDQHKLDAVRRMLTRLGMDVSKLIGEIQKLEYAIRECYEERIDLDGETLCWMLAMDACFILEFFRGSHPHYFSVVFQHANSMRYAIMSDIMKAENQIPLFILITLLQLELKSWEYAKRELANLLSNRLEFKGFPFSFSWDNNASELKKHIDKEPLPYHLLDLYRMVIIHALTNPSAESSTHVEPSTPVERDDYDGNNDHRRCGRSMNVNLSDCCINILPRPSATLSPIETSIPSAYLLHQAGIKFKPGKLGFKRRSEKSTLSFPEIHMWDSTEGMLRNLMAYEECQRCSLSAKQAVITQFVILLEHLITSEKDVAVLRKSQVIMSLLGSDEDTARMFNHLGNNHTFVRINEIEDVKREAREHYNRKMWMSQLNEEYFSKPWSLISFVAALLALGMTAVQTVYSVKN